MTEYMHLVGAEQMQAAARLMDQAADRMQSAASSLDGALERHHRFMDDWLQRFEAVAALNTGEKS